ncbi:MAG: 50S ribosome-binding GTPase [Methylobacter tundripaludum]|nr:50S ribosome-binding GTPase [Methylobacter tundripaludum]
MNEAFVNEKHFADELADEIEYDNTLSDDAKARVVHNLHKLKKTKVNILITGATGCGKSSTINALFNSEKAKVGQGVNPETMDVQKFEFNNIVLYDTPGLGDGKEADIKHSKNIIKKLYETDINGSLLIDLVLVILEGGSRDLGTSFELINQVIIPNLGEDKNRLLVAINQADMAMKGRYWNHKENRPEAELIKFLDEKVVSTQNRIKEATGIDVKPIYYCAGYKDGDQAQNPYNLSKLLLFILRHTKEEKRAAFAQDINRDKTMWADDDRLENYRQEIQETLWESIKSTASEGSDIGRDIFGGFGEVLFGDSGKRVGEALGIVFGGVVGGVAGLAGRAIKGIFSIFD